jgi:mono/diheme cytochrome c family protein
MFRKTLLAVLVIIVAVFALQIIPYGKDHSNPAIMAEPVWNSTQTKDLFARACADCHSHDTRWPWYSNYAPISWLIAHDVSEGREHFNVSAWGVQKRNKGDEAAEAVLEGDMPPWFYVIPHPEAQLSDREKTDLIKGLQETFGG